MTEGFSWDDIMGMPVNDTGDSDASEEESRTLPPPISPVPPPEPSGNGIDSWEGVPPPPNRPGGFFDFATPEQTASPPKPAPQPESEDPSLVDLNEIDTNLLTLISASAARLHRIVPFKREGDVFWIAFEDPEDLRAQDIANRTVAPYHVKVVRAEHDDIEEAIQQIEKASKMQQSVQQASAAVQERVGSTEEEIEDLTAGVRDSRVSQLLEETFGRALTEGASDLHFEPERTNFRIRARLDGVLHSISSSMDSALGQRLVSSLKTISNLDVAEHRKAQDGRTFRSVHGKIVDLRIGILPTPYGESATIRLLDPEQNITSMVETGFSSTVLRDWERLCKHRVGVILVSGPTGSGKTSTLASSLMALANEEVKVLTAEDPIEYQMEGIIQTQVNPAAGYDFREAIKRFLRHDPDIIMIGEVRDPETARAAAEASLTGHLVFATIHANYAVETALRLSEMGIPPYLVTASLRGVLAQRLIRLVCEFCKVGYEPSEAEMRAAGWPSAQIPKTIYRAGKGCPQCRRVGYKGRSAIGEVLMMTPAIREALLTQLPMNEVQRIAEENGMVPLRQAGLTKVAQGETTLEEIERVLGGE